jgi:hypothetical protein
VTLRQAQGEGGPDLHAFLASIVAERVLVPRVNDCMAVAARWASVRTGRDWRAILPAYGSIEEMVGLDLVAEFERAADRFGLGHPVEARAGDIALARTPVAAASVTGFTAIICTGACWTVVAPGTRHTRRHGHLDIVSVRG